MQKIAPEETFLFEVLCHKSPLTTPENSVSKDSSQVQLNQCKNSEEQWEGYKGIDDDSRD